MLIPNRKKRLQHFSFSDNFLTLFLLTLVFACGLVIVWGQGFAYAVLYLLLWVLSYFIIYAGTCRYCAYHGRRCPIPLEGGCVHHFFKKKDEPFGLFQLLWATITYGVRVILPVLVILRSSMTAWGIIYFSLLIVFWIIHLRFTGCPNCVNTQCPLNPDHKQVSNVPT